MGNVYFAPCHLLDIGLMLYAHATLLLEVVQTPHIVVTRVKDNLYTPICKLGKASQHPHKAAWHNRVILKPEVEDVTQEVDSLGIFCHHVEPATECTLCTHRVLNISTTEVYVRNEVYHLRSLA